jgi:hypothetical protein
MNVLAEAFSLPLISVWAINFSDLLTRVTEAMA